MKKNLDKISVKYAIVFVGVALSLLAVFAAGVLLAHSLKTRIAEFSGPFNQATSLVLNADRDLYQARVAALRYLDFAPNSAAARSARADYQENAQQARERLQSFLETMAAYPKVLAPADAFQARYDRWASASRKIFALHDRGEQRAAAAQLNGEAGQAFDQLRSVYDTLENATQAKIEALQAETFAQIRRQQLVAGVFSVLVAVIAVFIALVGPLKMSRAIRQVTARIREITDGDGDLTARISTTRGDEIGDLARNFNRFIARIDGTLASVRESTQSVSTASSEIAQGSQALASRTEQSAANLQETSAAMEEITSTVSNTSEAAEQGNCLAQSTADVARRGSEAMRDMETTMADIRGSASEISTITSLIDDIAFQTNLLALNASVEAARAGEHGRGFAVVAQEVRALANRAGNAAGDIRKLIETAVNRSQSGAELVHTTGATIAEIVASAERVTEVIGQISQSAREQSQGIEQINTAVTELDNATQQNAAMVEQTNAAAVQMQDQAAQLDELLASFRLSDGQGPAADAEHVIESTAYVPARREDPALNPLAA